MKRFSLFVFFYFPSCFCCSCWCCLDLTWWPTFFCVLFFFYTLNSYCSAENSVSVLEYILVVLHWSTAICRVKQLHNNRLVSKSCLGSTTNRGLGREPELFLQSLPLGKNVDWTRNRSVKVLSNKVSVVAVLEENTFNAFVFVTRAVWFIIN